MKRKHTGVTVFFLYYDYIINVVDPVHKIPANCQNKQNLTFRVYLGGDISNESNSYNDTYFCPSLTVMIREKCPCFFPSHNSSVWFVLVGLNI